MELASAYPNSAISTGAMVAIAVVMAGSLAIWLVMVFVADRRQVKGATSRRPSPGPGREVAEPRRSG